MKNLLFLLILPLSAEAFTLTQYLSSPEGSSVQRFILTPKKSEFIKSSNYFDKKKDYALGSFELAKGQVSDVDLKKVDEILTKIREVDTFMKKKNSSFNEMSAIKPHDAFLILDDFQISPKSTFYPELKNIFDQYAAREWKQISGIKLSEDQKQVIKIKDGKEISKEVFKFDVQCQSSTSISICSFKDVGILFVEKTK